MQDCSLEHGQPPGVCIPEKKLTLPHTLHASILTHKGGKTVVPLLAAGFESVLNMVGGTGSLCSPVALGNLECETTGLFLQRKGCITRYTPRRLEAGVVNSLETFTLPVWPGSSPDPHCRPAFLIQSKEILFMEGVTLTGQSFDVVNSSLYLAPFVPQGSHRIEFIITRKVLTKVSCA